MAYYLVSDTYVMGNIHQTKSSGNRFWSDRLYHQNPAPASHAYTELTFEFNVHNGPYDLVAGELFWVKFIPYDDGVAVFIAILGDEASGIGSASMSLSDLQIYTDAAATDLFASGATVFHGSWDGRGLFCSVIETDDTPTFIGGATYYASIRPPLTGSFSIVNDFD